MLDWQSTLHNWHFCQVSKSRDTKIGQISKSGTGTVRFRYCAVV